MQNKGLVKLFALLFGLVSIYQLSFTFITDKIEDDAKAYAVAQVPKPAEGIDTKENSDRRSQVEKAYLDSINKNEPISYGFTTFTYDEAKEKELNKGLDLKGGINVILQISVKDILIGLTNGSENETFRQALERADVLQRDAQEDYLESFFRAFDELKPEGLRLADPNIFFTQSLEEEYGEDPLNVSDDVVKNVLRRKVDQSIVSAKEVLSKRIDQFGVTQPNIQRLGTSGRILIELPGAKDVIRIEKLLQTTAELEFWKTYNDNTKLAQYLIAANQKLKELPEFSQETETEGETDETDELITSTEEDSLNVINPLFDKINIIPSGNTGGVIGTVKEEDKDAVLDLLYRDELKQVVPAELRYVRFAYGKEQNDNGTYDLYALAGERKGREAVPQMRGDVVDGAAQGYANNGKPNVNMQMNGIGAKQWEKLTEEVYNERVNIAVVLDNIVYSAPGVNNGKISGGNTEISGQFTVEEAQDLANVLRAGKLPAEADILQSEVVGPSLGQEAIDSGLMSFLIALGLVLVWMVFYYGRAGLFADVALAFNILLIFGVLANLGAVLTLPGIAGIVLTIGMSVDANVLLFERVREELANGKTLKEAIKHAFSWKGAMSSIFDANITTGLTALILFLFGTGPIKGFATTLLIGIGTSLFTAIFITRLLIDWYVDKGNTLDFSTAATKNLFRNMTIEFLKKRKVAYIISGIIIAIGLSSILFGNGLNQGVDFVGGRSYQVRFESTVNPQDVKSDLTAIFGSENSPEVKTFGEDNQLKITTKFKVNETGTAVDEEIKQMLFDGVKKYLPADMTYERFVDGAEDKQVGVMQSVKVGPTIADDIKKDSFWAVLGSLVVVFLYILLRFRKWQFSLGAVAAVFHDVLIVLGIFSLAWKYLPFTMEINQAFIAAILTVIGYSLNDTVVVFDRIREFMDDHSNWRLSRVVNGALNSTLSRTLNTSLTTLVVLLAIFIFGGESIRGFMFALIVGVIVGTYSSMFIATPIMFDTIKKGDINKGLEETK